MIAELATIEDGDIVVVAQKAVSKVEGQIVRIEGIEPSAKARELAGDERDPREVEVILQEAVQIIRERGPLVIAQTRHGTG
jgi:coenzyme F420-0:L-glutamate ligase/coenzyme F420-1:gamma-L-glutamate ligase